MTGTALPYSRQEDIFPFFQRILPSIEQIFEKLALAAGNGLTPEHEQQLRLAGYDLDSICDSERPQSERFHDALFVTETSALAVIGSNLVRIGYSMKACTDIVAAFLPGKVADIGGACGIVCFDAALKFPDRRFAIIDRSDNALSVGRQWAEQLDHRNVMFVRREFSQTQSTDEITRDYDLALLEYVLDVSPACDDEDSIIIQMTPALARASRILRPAGALQVRFGEFHGNGFTALIRSAFRIGFVVESIDATAQGNAIVFRKGITERERENSETTCAFDDFLSEYSKLSDLSPE